MNQWQVNLLLSGFGLTAIIGAIFFCLWMSSDNRLRELEWLIARLEAHTGIPAEEEDPPEASDIPWWRRQLIWIKNKFREREPVSEPERTDTEPSDLPRRVQQVHLEAKLLIAGEDKARGRRRPTPFKRPKDYDDDDGRSVVKSFGEHQFTFREETPDAR